MTRKRTRERPRAPLCMPCRPARTQLRQDAETSATRSSARSCGSRAVRPAAALVLAHQDVIERLLDEESAALGELEVQLGKRSGADRVALHARPVRRRAHVRHPPREPAMTVVAAVQMTSARPRAQPRGRRTPARERRERGAVVAALPENFAFMGLAESDKLAIAEDDDARADQAFLATRARELGLWIVGGTIPLRSPASAGGGRDPCARRGGGRAARYDKIHLFDVEVPGRDERYQESASVRPGRARVRRHAGRPPRPRGLLRRPFPELFRRLSRMGGSGSACPPRSRAHRPCAWETLLRARRSRTWPLVAPAQSGFHENGRETMVIR